MKYISPYLWCYEQPFSTARPVASSFKLVRPGSGCGNKVGVSVGVDKMLINKYINMYMLIKNYKTVILKILQIYQCGAQSN